MGFFFLQSLGVAQGYIVLHLQRNVRTLFTTAIQRHGGNEKLRVSAILAKRVVERKVFILPLLLIALSGCTTGKRYRIPRNQKPQIVKMETTGYCKCGKCCGWKRNWKFQPVFASGPQKGKPKKVGITATGEKAGWGTIAADTRYYPFGTIMYIPGYGWGRVEDVGGGIKGQHIDLYFPSHRQALEWGREWKTIKIWKP